MINRINKKIFKLQDKRYHIEKKIMEFEEDIHDLWKNEYEFSYNSSYNSSYELLDMMTSSKEYEGLMLKKEFIDSQIDFYYKFYSEELKLV